MNRCKVQEIAELITKGTTPTTLGFSYIDEGINFVKIESIDANGNFDKTKFAHISEECHVSLKRSKLQKNDILFSIAGAIGRTAIVSEDILPANTNQALAIIRLKKNNNDLNFIRYQLSSASVIKQTEKQKQGVAQLNLSLKDIGNLEINIPSLPEQQKIAAHLDSIQSAIDNKKQQLQQLDELVKSKFVEMFGDVSLNDKNFDTEIGKNLFKFSSGKFLSAEFRLESGIPVYGGNGIAWYTEKPLIEYSTIIIGRVGAYCGNVKLVTEPVWITDNALFIKEFKTSRFNLQFLIKLMENINFAKYAGKVAQPKITQGPLEEQVYIIPPIELQNTFAEYVQKIDSAKSIIKTQLVDLQELLDSKMDEYFGE